MKTVHRRWLLPILVIGIAFGSARIAQAQALDAITKRGTVRVGINLSTPPFGMMDNNMQPAGYDVDVATMLAHDLGVKLQFVPVTNESRVPALLTGKADLIISSLQITPERARSVLFSSPYVMHTSMVLAPAATKITALSDLAGKRVGVARGSVYADILAHAGIPDLHLVQFEDDSATMNALVAGQVDAIGTVSFLASTLQKRYPDQHYEQKIALRDNFLGIGLRPGEFDLLHWVNTFIFIHHQNGDLSRSSQQWLGKPLTDLPSF